MNGNGNSCIGQAADILALLAHTPTRTLESDRGGWFIATTDGRVSVYEGTVELLRVRGHVERKGAVMVLSAAGREASKT